MITQDISVGANYAAARCGRVLTPPALDGRLFAAYAFGSDFEPDVGRDLSGNERHGILYGVGADDVGMVMGPLNYLEYPFTGADLMAAGGKVSLISYAKVATNQNAALFGNYVGDNKPSMSLTADSTFSLSAYAWTSVPTDIHADFDATRGDEFRMYAAEFEAAAFGFYAAGPANPTVVGYGAAINAPPFTGGVGLISSGFFPRSPAVFTGTSTKLFDLAYVGDESLSLADLQAVFLWLKGEAAKSRIA